MHSFKIAPHILQIAQIDKLCATYLIMFYKAGMESHDISL